MQNEVRRFVERHLQGQRHVPVRTRERTSLGKDPGERAAELAACTRDQDSLLSRSDRIGDCVLQS